MNKIQLVVFLLMLSLAKTLWGMSFESLPLGYVESFMANTGTALGGSPGNVIFNPAGMAWSSKEVQFSANGLNLNRYENKFASGESSPTIKSTNVVPTLLASQFSTGDHFLGIYIYSPGTYRLEGGMDSIRGGIAVDDFGYRFSIDFTVITAGINWARKINSEMSMGVNFNLIKSDQTQFNYMKLQIQNPAYKTLETTYSKTESLSAQLGLGFFHKPSPQFQWGVRLSSPSNQLTGSGVREGYRCEDSTNSDVYSDKDKTFAPILRMPMDLRVGTMWNVGEWSFLGDLAKSGDIEYVTPSAYSDEDKMHSYEENRIHLGIIKRMSPTFNWLGGYHYSVAKQSDDFALVSIGLQLVRPGKNEFGIGAYYGTNTTLPTSSSEAYYGVLLISKYEL